MSKSGCQLQDWKKNHIWNYSVVQCLCNFYNESNINVHLFWLNSASVKNTIILTELFTRSTVILIDDICKAYLKMYWHIDMFRFCCSLVYMNICCVINEYFLTETIYFKTGTVTLNLIWYKQTKDFLKIVINVMSLAVSKNWKVYVVRLTTAHICSKSMVYIWFVH